MFTIKLYSEDGYRSVIKSAESFTILREGGEAEITLHQRNPAEDSRVDIRHSEKSNRAPEFPPSFGKAIIENAAGRTTEMVTLGPRILLDHYKTPADCKIDAPGKGSWIA